MRPATSDFGDLVHGNVERYMSQFVGLTNPDVLRRVFHSTQAPPR
jgi:hypothetical protein